MKKLRLGVNIDHVATIRNARGGDVPDPIRAAKIAASSGADGITAHLREDRRHIRDGDIIALKSQIDLPLNLEMAATDEMLEIALKAKPNAACIVPEKRQELTTEGGLDVFTNKETLARYVSELKKFGIRVSLFIDADENQIKASKEIGADIVELHTGLYAENSGKEMQKELERIKQGAAIASDIGLECHAGHGLNYDNVSAIAAIEQVVELNIGHFLIGEAIFIGLAESIQKMRSLMIAARND